MWWIRSSIDLWLFNVLLQKNTRQRQASSWIAKTPIMIANSLGRWAKPPSEASILALSPLEEALFFFLHVGRRRRIGRTLPIDMMMVRYEGRSQPSGSRSTITGSSTYVKNRRSSEIHRAWIWDIVVKVRREAGYNMGRLQKEWIKAIMFCSSWCYLPKLRSPQSMLLGRSRQSAHKYKSPWHRHAPEPTDGGGLALLYKQVLRVRK